ncbi:MAG: hypothetical protein ACFB0B_09185 [Thermonemataceae bacterium]
MKKLLVSLLVVLFWQGTQAQTTEALYEEAKLTMVCKAIQFNCREQGQKQIADQLTCESYASINTTLPANFKSSRRILNTFKGKKYANTADLEGRLDQLSEEVINELRRIGNAVKNSQAEKDSWQAKVDEVVMDFTRVKDEALLAATPATTQDEEENETAPVATQEEETTTPLTPYTDEEKATESNTGLWITTILATLIALVSLGYAYMVKSTVLHRIKQAEGMYRERYIHLDERMDQLITKEELLRFEETFGKQLTKTQQIQENTEKSSKVQETVMKEAYEQVINESPVYYAKFHPNGQHFVYSEFTQVPNKESFYKIEIDPANPDKASFQIVEDPHFQQIALNYADVLLATACTFTNEVAEANKIVNVEKGALQKEGDAWKVITPASIRFEQV